MYNTPYSRGDIAFVRSSNIEPETGHEMWSDRLAVIVSNDTSNKMSAVLSVVYLSTAVKKRSSPLHVYINSGMEQCVALTEQIQTVDKSRVASPIDHVSDEELRNLDKALCFSLGIQQENYRSVFKKWEEYIKLYNIPVVEELENIASQKVTDVIARLRQELTLTRKEREAFQLLSESYKTQLDEMKGGKE